MLTDAQALAANLRRAEQAALATVPRDTRAPAAVRKADADQARLEAELGTASETEGD